MTTTRVVKTENPTCLIPILEERLPVSCCVLNQVKFHEKYGNDMEIYVVGSGDKEGDTWVIIKWMREDWNYFTCVSAPRSCSENSEAADEFRLAIAGSEIIDWSIHSFFSPMEKITAKMVLNAYVEGLETTVSARHWTLFYMTPEQGLNLEVDPKDKNIRLGPLTVEEMPFIADSWDWGYISSKENVRTVVRKLIERHPSSGVYLKNSSGEEELVCAAVFGGSGRVSMVHTSPSHRRKGYGSLCVRNLFRELAREGLWPCLGAVAGNVGAFKTYDKIEVLQRHPVDWTFITVRPNDVH